MKALKLSDVIVIGMFMIGLALAVSYQTTHQDIQTAEIVMETLPEQDALAIDANRI